MIIQLSSRDATIPSSIIPLLSSSRDVTTPNVRPTLCVVERLSCSPPIYRLSGPPQQVLIQSSILTPLPLGLSSTALKHGKCSDPDAIRERSAKLVVKVVIVYKYRRLATWIESGMVRDDGSSWLGYNAMIQACKVEKWKPGWKSI